MIRKYGLSSLKPVPSLIKEKIIYLRNVQIGTDDGQKMNLLSVDTTLECIQSGLFGQVSLRKPLLSKSEAERRTHWCMSYLSFTTAH